jgi:hypothetical protein
MLRKPAQDYPAPNATSGSRNIMPETIYKNHLKSAYSIESAGKHLIITGASFYRLNGETAWLLNELPGSGTKELYLEHLSNLGLAEPRTIFYRLVDIGALTIKCSPSLKAVFNRLINPRIRIFTPQIQERFLNFFGIELKADLWRWLPLLIPVSSAGLLWGAFLTLAGQHLAIPVPLAGHPNWLFVFLLALTGSLVHELGHSWMTAAAGIGLRPIGLSIYMIFPVFHTNVSGVETVPFKQKALIDCGGFLFQGIFIFALLTAASTTGNSLFSEAARWIMALVLFNLNPFFRTDGYWLYKDFYDMFRDNRLARTVHMLYCTAFTAFSVYFLWRLGGRLADIPGELSGLAGSHGNLFSRGYSAVMLVYFLVMGFVASLRRFREIRQELNEVKMLKVEL